MGSNYAGCKNQPGGPILSSCTFVNPLQGLRTAAKASPLIDSGVQYVQGVDIDTTDTSRIKDAVDAAKNADVVIFIGGLITCQETGDQCIEAEARDRSSGASPPRDFGIGLPGKQLDLLQAIANQTETKIIVVLMSGSAVAVPWAANNPRVSA